MLCSLLGYYNKMNLKWFESLEKLGLSKVHVKTSWLSVQLCGSTVGVLSKSCGAWRSEGSWLVVTWCLLNANSFPLPLAACTTMKEKDIFLLFGLGTNSDLGR